MDEIKYLASGHEVFVIEKLSDGKILIQETLDYGEDELYPGEFRVVDKVFDSTPTYKYDEKIKLLKDEIEKLTKTKKMLQSQIEEIEEQEKSRLEKYKQHKQLELLDDYLDGKITHFAVLVPYGPKITSIDHEKCGDWKGKTKLLTLFGNSKGNLAWKLNQYKDGSGCWKTVIPCTSYEQALSVMQDFLDDIVKDEKRSPSGSIIDFAKKHNLKIDETYTEKWKFNRKNNIDKEIKGHEDKILSLKKDKESL